MGEKLQIDIYKGLPMVLEKVKGVALSAVIGKSNAWLMQKLGKYVVKGRVKEFVNEDLCIVNQGLALLGDEILQNLVSYSPHRESVISQVKTLSSFVCMPYIYTDVLKEKKTWFDNRMKARSSEGKASSFKEDDILKINMAAMQIANELKSIELILKEER